MTEERAFQIMKYASKKKTKQMKEAEKEFIKLSIQNNVEKNKYEKIWSIILDTGKYSFNESHAIAYALICYYTAYLKTHYPIYWMKNVLSNYYISINGTCECNCQGETPSSSNPNTGKESSSKITSSSSSSSSNAKVS